LGGGTDIFAQVMDTGAYGPNNEEAIVNLEIALKNHYVQIKEPYTIRGKLTLERLKTSKDWPKLKAKGAPTRHAIKFAKTLAETHNTGSLHDRRRLAVCTLLDNFYEILDTNPRYICDADKAKLAPLVQSFIGVYEKLSREALRLHMRRWKMVQNFHMFIHLAEIQIPKFGNARFYWTYSDEDLMKLIKEIALSKLHINTLDFMVLYKWAIMFFDRDEVEDAMDDIVVIDE
jgi:hypothetical protein